MVVYNILVTVLFVFFIISLFLKGNIQITRFLIFISALLLIFIASNRALEVGTDTLTYYLNFQNIEFEDSVRTYQGIQKGWYYFNYYIHSFLDYDLFMYIVYSIIISLVCYVSYKNSKQPIFSILLFVLLYFYFSSFNVMRQFLALSFMLLGYTFLYIGDKKKFVLCLIISSLFHFTALLMMPLLFIDKLKISSKFVYLLVPISFIIGIWYSSLLENIVTYMTIFTALNEGVSGYLDAYGGERSFFSNFIINTTFLITYYFAKDKRNIWLLLYLLFIISNNLFGSFGQANRIFWYFQISMLIVLPNTWGNIKNKFYRTCYILFVLVYAYSIYFISLNANASEVLPYSFR